MFESDTIADMDKCVLGISFLASISECKTCNSIVRVLNPLATLRLPVKHSTNQKSFIILYLVYNIPLFLQALIYVS